MVGLLMTAGCASVPLEQGGSLSSYEHLAASNGMLTHARLSVSKNGLLAAKTVHIVPTAYSDAAAKSGLSPVQRKMVANAIDRAVCVGLSERFHVLAMTEPADLTVHAEITHVIPTNEVAAGASRAASVGVSVAEKVLIPQPVPIPVPVPRIPIGLGGLGVEAEAVDQDGRQQAAILWARGADAFTTRPKVSKAGDAYSLATSFAADFSKLLIAGSDPFHSLPSLPSLQSIPAMFGGGPKEAACEVFGRSPGVPGMIGDALAFPPEWTDKGAPVNGDQRPGNQ